MKLYLYSYMAVAFFNKPRSSLSSVLESLYSAWVGLRCGRPVCASTRTTAGQWATVLQIVLPPDFSLELCQG